MHSASANDESNVALLLPPLVLDLSSIGAVVVVVCDAFIDDFVVVCFVRVVVAKVVVDVLDKPTFDVASAVVIEPLLFDNADDVIDELLLLPPVDVGIGVVDLLVAVVFAAVKVCVVGVVVARVVVAQACEAGQLIILKVSQVPI